MSGNRRGDWRATDHLVQALLPGVRVSDDTLAEIYALSRGNPLFVRELTDGISPAAA
jgi:predicted ATPase